MDDSLMPPSAFLDTINPMIRTNYDQNFIRFTPFLPYNYQTEKISNLCNSFTQTENVKLASKGSLTISAVLTQEEMNDKLKQKKLKFMEKMDLLKQEHSQTQAEMSEIIDKLNKQLSELSKEKFSYQEELNKMRFYITGTENRETWLNEKQKLLEEIDQLDTDAHEQRSIINSLKIQLASMEKIQSIQEKELEKDIVNSSSHQTSTHEIKFEALLKFWRHKVLSLLVQKESNEICVNKEKYQLRNEILRHKNEIEHLYNTIETLKLKLQSAEAKFSSDDIIIEKLKRENANLCRELDVVIEEKMDYQHNIDVMFKKLIHFQSQMEKSVEHKLQKAGSKIEVLQRRLEYANSRFPMIEASVIRNNNLTVRLETFDRHEKDLPRDSMEFKIRELEEALLISSKEIQQLGYERNQLIMTIERDSASFNDRINEKREELEGEMTSLQSTVAQQEKTFNKVIRELEILKNENARIKSDYDQLLGDKYNETENYQATLNESRSQVSKLSLEFSEFKRGAAKSKRKLEEQIQWYEQKLQERESYWKKCCDETKAECNLLKLTIRQDGILTNLKKRVKKDKSRDRSQSPRKDSEMESVLKEVENLTNELQINIEDCK